MLPAPQTVNSPMAKGATRGAKGLKPPPLSQVKVEKKIISFNF